MPKIYTVTIEAKAGNYPQLDQQIPSTEATALETLLQQIRSSSSQNDAEGVFNYLRGFDWFCVFHPFKPGDTLSFALLLTTFHSGSDGKQPVWKQEYEINGVPWVMSLSVRFERGQTTEITIPSTEA